MGHSGPVRLDCNYLKTHAPELAEYPRVVPVLALDGAARLLIENRPAGPENGKSGGRKGRRGCRPVPHGGAACKKGRVGRKIGPFISSALCVREPRQVSCLQRQPGRAHGQGSGGVRIPHDFGLTGICASHALVFVALTPCLCSTRGAWFFDQSGVHAGARVLPQEGNRHG